MDVQSQSTECISDRHQWHVAEQLAVAIDGRDFRPWSGAETRATLESIHTITEAR